MKKREIVGEILIFVSFLFLAMISGNEETTARDTFFWVSVVTFVAMLGCAVGEFGFLGRHKKVVGRLLLANFFIAQQVATFCIPWPLKVLDTAILISLLFFRVYPALYEWMHPGWEYEMENMIVRNLLSHEKGGGR